MTLPVFSEQCYAKMIMHAYKYPYCAVIGLLIGRLEAGELRISDAVPVLHESASSSMTMEMALISVDTYCTKNKTSIIGVYFCNEILTDSSLDHYATRIAEKLSSYMDALLVQIDNASLGKDTLVPAIKVYVAENKNWKLKDFRLENEETVLLTVSEAVQRKLYSDLMDFENHLDNPCNDYWNLLVNEHFEHLS